MNLSTDWISAIGQAVGALATSAAVGVALWLARRDEQRRKRQAHREQAEQITAWLEDFDSPRDQTEELYLTLALGNASAKPAYEIVATLVAIQGAYWHTAVGVEGQEFRRRFVWQLPPGERKSQIPYDGGFLGGRWGVELAFRDAAGQCWLRSANGELVETAEAPLALYGIDPPVDWQFM